MDAPIALTCIGRICGPREKANNGSMARMPGENLPIYTERERAAIAWTEAVTNIRRGQVADEVFEKTQHHFSEKELADLTLAVATIDAWNRLVISVRAVPGKYKQGETFFDKAAA